VTVGHLFLRRHASVRILLNFIFCPVFTKKSRGGMCSMNVPTMLPHRIKNIIRFSTKILRREKFYRVIFSSQYSAENRVMDLVGQNVRNSSIKLIFFILII
jgi:hypothetical protein